MAEKASSLLTSSSNPVQFKQEFDNYNIYMYIYIMLFAKPSIALPPARPALPEKLQENPVDLYCRRVQRQLRDPVMWLPFLRVINRRAET